MMHCAASSCKGTEILPKVSLPSAILTGNLSEVKSVYAYFYDNYPNLMQDPSDMFDLSCYVGSIDLMKWMVETFGNHVGSRKSMDLVCFSGNLQALQFICQYHLDWTCSALALDLAARNGHNHCIEWILDHHLLKTQSTSSLSKPTQFKSNAIEFAAESGHLTCVEWLCTHNYDQVEFVISKSAIDLAAENGHADIVKCLLRFRLDGGSIDGVVRACRAGHAEIVSLLLPILLVNCADNNNKSLDSVLISCLLASIDFGSIDMFVTVLSSSSSSSPVSSSILNKLPHAAASKGKIEILKYLLEDEMICCSITVLDAAAGNGYLDTVVYLHELQEKMKGRIESNESVLLVRLSSMMSGCENNHADDDNGCGVIQKQAADRLLIPSSSQSSLDDSSLPPPPPSSSNCISNQVKPCRSYSSMDSFVSDISRSTSSEEDTSISVDSDSSISRLAHSTAVLSRSLMMKCEEFSTALATDSALSSVIAKLAENDTADHDGHTKLLALLESSANYAIDWCCPGCTTGAMDLACANGHLRVVQFLQHNRKEGCSQDAIDKAVENGHAEVVNFLVHSRGMMYSRHGISRAAGNGFVTVLAWIRNMELSRCSSGNCSTSSSTLTLPVSTCTVGLFNEDDVKAEAIANRQSSVLSWISAGCPCKPIELQNYLLERADESKIMSREDQLQSVSAMLRHQKELAATGRSHHERKPSEERKSRVSNDKSISDSEQSKLENLLDPTTVEIERRSTGSKNSSRRNSRVLQDGNSASGIETLATSVRDMLSSFFPSVFGSSEDGHKL